MISIKKRLLTIAALGFALTFVPTSVAKADELTTDGTEVAASTEAAAETTFDANYYATTYPDVVTIFGNNPDTLYWHYVNFGKAEGRFANAQEALNAALGVNQQTDTTSTVETTPSDATVPAQVIPGIETVKNGTYNVLAIGNSITLHPVCSYWWGSWGMAASSMDKDYIHQVQAGLLQKYETVNLDIISVQSWETSSARSKQLSKFDAKLANDYDLIIIQLGENVNNMSTFKKDFSKLVSYVKNAQPEAKVVIVGDYWYRDGRDAAKIDVAAKQGCAYADISYIRGKKAYRATSGSEVLGDDKKLHKIYNSAVLKHPNDAGMEYIANKILEAVQ